MKICGIVHYLHWIRLLINRCIITVHYLDLSTNTSLQNRSLSVLELSTDKSLQNSSLSVYHSQPTHSFPVVSVLDKNTKNSGCSSSKRNKIARPSLSSEENIVIPRKKKIPALSETSSESNIDFINAASFMNDINCDINCDIKSNSMMYNENQTTTLSEEQNPLENWRDINKKPPRSRRMRESILEPHNIR